MFKKENIKNIIILILLLLVLAIGGWYFYKVDKLNSEIVITTKLNASLTDTLRVVKEDNGTLRYEKLAIQGDIKKLEDGNITLSEEKKELISEVKKLNKIKDIFAATVIKQSVTIDSLNKIKTNGVFIDSTTVAFEKLNNDTINYQAKAYNVSKVLGKTPLLEIYHLDIPNTQTIGFGWDKDKRADYPVSVSIKNSNPMFKVNNVEAYAIPELQKQDVKPTFWQKVKKTLKGTTGKALLVGAGIAIGVLIGSQ